jgi:hypothetical protein
MNAGAKTILFLLLIFMIFFMLFSSLAGRDALPESRRLMRRFYEDSMPAPPFSQKGDPGLFGRDCLRLPHSDFSFSFIPGGCGPSRLSAARGGREWALWPSPGKGTA